MEHTVRERCQHRIRQLERRLAALHDLGLDVAVLQSQLSFVNDLAGDGRHQDALTLAEDLLGLAEGLAQGKRDREELTRAVRASSQRFYERQHTVDEVKDVLESGLLQRMLSKHLRGHADLDESDQREMVAAFQSGMRHALVDMSPQGEGITSRIDAAVSRQVQHLREEIGADGGAAAADPEPIDIEDLARRVAADISGRDNPVHEGLLTRLRASLGEHVGEIEERLGSRMEGMQQRLDQLAQVLEAGATIQRKSTTIRRRERAPTRRPTTNVVEIGEDPSGDEPDMLDAFEAATSGPQQSIELDIDPPTGATASSTASTASHEDEPPAAAQTVLTARHGAAGGDFPPADEGRVESGPQPTAADPSTSALEASPASADDDEPRDGTADVAPGSDATGSGLAEREPGSTAQPETAVPDDAVAPSPSTDLQRRSHRVVEETARERDEQKQMAASEPNSRPASDESDPGDEVEDSFIAEVASMLEDSGYQPAPPPTATEADSSDTQRMAATAAGAAMGRDQLLVQLRALLPELLKEEEIKQQLFALIATEAVVNPGVLGDLTGLRRFLAKEIDRAVQQANGLALP